MNGTRILLSFFAVPVFLFITVFRLDDNKSFLAASQVTAIASGSYFSALITSILVYRVFFHPLRNFPGPFSVRLSKFFHTLLIGKESKNNVLADQLHQQYGEFVRSVSLHYSISTCPRCCEVLS
jgi:tryprostatin B 6-hydroxylase